MYTISDIIRDINRGCAANNMIEDKFSYRIIFFINEGDRSCKRYIDTVYGDLRKTLESIIRNYLSLTNSVVIAETTVRKGGECVRLQSQSYAFSLDEYFKRINGDCVMGGRRGNYNRYAVG